ncbi:MAG: SpoIIE family protein phosphatase [Acidobacteriaceae bacterium]
MLYFLLGLYILASTTYFVANTAAFIDNYFDLHRRPHTPLQFDIDTLKITSLRPEAAKTGLAKDDTLIAVDGSPYAGFARWLTLLRRDLHPGDTLAVTVRTPSGAIQNASIVLSGRTQSDAIHFKELGPLFIMFALASLVCLLVGYWVVAARPDDLSAWLILSLLSFPDVLFFAANWWTGPWIVLQGVWFTAQQIAGPLVLLLIGIYFPERWRFDRKLPWAKWILLVPPIACLGLILWLQFGDYYHPAWNHWSILLNPWIERIVNPINLICVLLYWVAIFDKMRSAESADSRRRLQVLAAGSIVGLGSLLIIFVLLPHFGIAAQSRPWLAYIGVTLSLVFPFTLAYVVVVQRAMDVRILLRMGTKYALARATLAVVRTGLLIVLAILLIRLVRAPSLTPRTAIEIAVLAGLLLLLRLRLTRNLSSWLDRKFFREAYNAEHLLSELSQRVRKYTDTGAMLEMVSKSLAETLHIEKIGVLLRDGNSFQLQQAVGLDFGGFASQPVHLSLNSTTVRNLMRINTPVTLYRENPDGWLLLASAQERSLLDAMSTELLLPLSGRDQLMGLITLGPKRSEEPYTPSDLRLLESVATQTGLALEIGNLARSLASEATRRERIDREMEVAREVQERLFPQEFPVIEGVSLAGHCRPQQGVGGDYYDLFALGDGRIGIAIGDVSGKGISAALLMSSLRASLRGMTLDAPHDLAAMMEKVNRLVYEASATNRYATFFFATYCAATHDLVYVNAGHNAPFLVRRVDDQFQILRLEVGGPVVGLLSFATYEEQRLVLEAGDLLLTYTDGISEAMTEEEEEWGEERMLAAAQTLPEGTAQEILDHLFAETDRFTGKAPQFDDMTLLVLKLARE